MSILGTAMKVFGLAGGPVGWFTTAVSWVYDAAQWCMKHWKIVLSVLVIVWAFAAGWHYKGQRDTESIAEARAATAAVQKKFDNRLALEAVIDAEHEAEKVDLHNDNAAIKKDTGKKLAGLTEQKKNLEKKVADYVANHSKPAPPGSCPTDADIGLDGVRLINGELAASRILRAGGSDAGRHEGVRAPAGSP